MSTADFPLFHMMCNVVHLEPPEKGRKGDSEWNSIWKSGENPSVELRSVTSANPLAFLALKYGG